MTLARMNWSRILKIVVPTFIVVVLSIGLFSPVIKTVYSHYGISSSVASNASAIAMSHCVVAIISSEPKPVGVYQNGEIARNTNEWAIHLAQLGGLNNSLIYFARYSDNPDGRVLLKYFDPAPAELFIMAEARKG